MVLSLLVFTTVFTPVFTTVFTTVTRDGGDEVRRCRDRSVKKRKKNREKKKEMVATKYDFVEAGLFCM